MRLGTTIGSLTANKRLTLSYPCQGILRMQSVASKPGDYLTALKVEEYQNLCGSLSSVLLVHNRELSNRTTSFHL